MLNFINRPFMILAAAIAGYFVARDAVNFTIIQMVVALFLITVLVALAAFWEFFAEQFSPKSSRRKP